MEKRIIETKYGQVTEKEVTGVMRKVIKKFKRTFSFAHYTEEDIAQECWLAGWKALRSYNPKYPLYNYLYNCVRQKLLNLKRNNLRDVVPPCKESHENYLNGIDDFSVEYTRWVKNNQAKQRVRVPVTIGDFEPTAEENLEDYIFIREIRDKVRSSLSKRTATLLDMFLDGKIELPPNHEVFLEIKGLLDGQEG